MDSVIRVRPALIYTARECIVLTFLMLTIEHVALWGVGQIRFSSDLSCTYLFKYTNFQSNFLLKPNTYFKLKPMSSLTIFIVDLCKLLMLFR